MSSEMTTRRAMFLLILLLFLFLSLILLRVNQKLIEARKFEFKQWQYSSAFGTIWNICSQVKVKEGNFVVDLDLEMFWSTEFVLLLLLLFGGMRNKTTFANLRWVKFEFEFEFKSEFEFQFERAKQSLDTSCALQRTRFSLSFANLEQT